MAVLSAGVEIAHIGNPNVFSFVADANDAYYRGALVFIDTGGNVVVGPGAGDKLAGICRKTNTAVLAGENVEVYIDGVFEVPCSSIAVTDEGSALFIDAAAFSDNTADAIVGAFGANDILVGKILKYSGGDRCWVQLHAIDGLWVATAGWGG